MSSPKIYTRTGDDGTTGLYFGGRVAKDSEQPRAYGAVDEAQSVMGVARAHRDGTTEQGAEVDRLLILAEKDLYVLMAELATAPSNHHKLTPGTTAVTEEMVAALETEIDQLKARFEAPSQFIVPGEDLVAAYLDVARAVVRRAERNCISAVVDGSHVLAYLNRLSDLLWTLARWVEGQSLATKEL